MDPREEGIGAEVVYLSGDLDAAALPRLRSQLEPYLDEVADSGRWLILDLSQVGFVGAAALRVLWDVRAATGRVRLQAVPGIVVRMLEITGLAPLFPEVGEPDEHPVTGRLRSRSSAAGFPCPVRHVSISWPQR